MDLSGLVERMEFPSITPSPPHPIAERDLFVQPILIGDAGFAAVLLEVLAVACPSPSLLVEVVIEAMLGASPSSSAALKARATKGSRIMREIWRRFTWIRNSDAGWVA